MKKALSIILALVLAAAMLPMASALSTEETAAYVEAYIKSMIYSANVYTPAKANETIPQLYVDGFKEAETNIVKCDKNSLEVFADEISASKAVLDKANQDVEALIASGEVEVVIDSTRYLTDYYHMFAEYDINKISEFFEKIDSDVTLKLDIISEEIEDYLGNGYVDPAVVNQEEFDDIAEDFYFFYSTARKCLGGSHTAETFTDTGAGTHKADCILCKADFTENHVWGQYIPDNYGSKTAKCISCDATDTTVDENYSETELPGDEVEDEDFITRIFNMIADFFASIAEFFRNLFK